MRAAFGNVLYISKNFLNFFFVKSKKICTNPLEKKFEPVYNKLRRIIFACKCTKKLRLRARKRRKELL